MTISPIWSSGNGLGTQGASLNGLGNASIFEAFFSAFDGLFAQQLNPAAGEAAVAGNFPAGENIEDYPLDESFSALQDVLFELHAGGIESSLIADGAGLAAAYEHLGYPAAEAAEKAADVVGMLQVVEQQLGLRKEAAPLGVDVAAKENRNQKIQETLLAALSASVHNVEGENPGLHRGAEAGRQLQQAASLVPSHEELVKILSKGEALNSSALAAGKLDGKVFNLNDVIETVTDENGEIDPAALEKAIAAAAKGEKQAGRQAHPQAVVKPDISVADDIIVADGEEISLNDNQTKRAERAAEQAAAPKEMAEKVLNALEAPGTKQGPVVREAVQEMKHERNARAGERHEPHRGNRLYRKECRYPGDARRAGTAKAT